MLPFPELEYKAATGENVTALIETTNPRLSRDMTISEYVIALVFFETSYASECSWLWLATLT